MHMQRVAAVRPSLHKDIVFLAACRHTVAALPVLCSNILTLWCCKRFAAQKFQFSRGCAIPYPPNMDGQGQHPLQPAPADKAVQSGARKDLNVMRADVSMCKQTLVQLRGMLDELQRKQNEAIADMFKTVVFRLNGSKRIDSPSKQQ